MAYTLYKISNLCNGKSYIGLTSDFGRRIYSHLSGNGGSKLINEDLKIYSKEDFEVTTLQIIEEQEEAKSSEREAIAKYKCIAPNGYNIINGSSGGATPWLGKDFPEEMRHKISQSNFGKKDTEETKANKSKAHSQRYSNPEERKKTSDRMKLWWAERKGALA